MKKQKEKTPSLDDIVFGPRNKEYGAYQLRKKYPARLAIGLITATTLVTLALIIPFIKSTRNNDMVLMGGGGSRSVNVTFDDLPAPEDRIYIDQPPPRPPSRPVEMDEAVKYAAPDIVDTLPPIFEEFATMDEALMEFNDSATVAPIDDIFYSDGFDFGIGGTGGSGTPFLLVEEMPSFRGGDLNTFRQWVQQRTNYPQEAIDQKIQGRVLITFIVEKDGTVSNVTVVRSVHPSIDNEAARVISSSPKWSPGLQSGKPVRVRYSMWLGFLL